MKKRLLAICLALVMVFALLPVASAATVPTEEQAYASMIALKSSYPEGMAWTNDNSYTWKGGIYSAGYGCAGFAFMLSDAAFGDLPARMLTSFQYSDVKVGDILRINHNTHSVIILEVHENNVILAEGNYNSSVHWGRSLSRQDVMAADYLMTRYPEQPAQSEQPEQSAQSQPADPTNDALTVNGVPVTPTAYKIDGANYFKLRDVAMLLDGSPKQFNVVYDDTNKSVIITTGESYVKVGGELAGVPTNSVTADPTNNAVFIDGVEVTDLIVYKINGENYFQLRNLAEKLDFNVGWIKGQGMFIEGDKPYDPSN